MRKDFIGEIKDLNIFSKTGLIDVFSLEKITDLRSIIIESKKLVIIDIYRIISLLNDSIHRPNIIIIYIIDDNYEYTLLKNLANEFVKFKIYLLDNETYKNIRKTNPNGLLNWLRKQNINEEFIKEFILIFGKLLSNKADDSKKLIKIKNKKHDQTFGIIVQARMSSSRLPGKAMLDICGEPVILKILKRLSNEFGKDFTIFSTSNNRNDDFMAEYIKEKGYKVYRGEENNLVERFLSAALDNNFHHIARVTGDDLFRDIDTLKIMYDLMIKDNYDYIYSDDLILGCNSEIMKIDTLFFIKEFARLKNETHALSFFLDRSDLFHTKRFLTNHEKRPSISLAMDEFKDYESIKIFWEQNDSFCESNWEYKELLKLINKNIKIFNHHPFDVGLLNRDKKLQSFIFE